MTIGVEKAIGYIINIITKRSAKVILSVIITIRYLEKVLSGLSSIENH